MLVGCGKSVGPKEGVVGGKISTPSSCLQYAALSVGVKAKVPSGWDAEALLQNLKIEVIHEKWGITPVEMSLHAQSLQGEGPWELPGLLQVKATLGDHSATLPVNVGLTPDGCHVVTVSVAVELSASGIVLTESK